MLGLSTLFIAANWLVFIYAVTSGQVLQASLGYFINPLVSVLLGVVFFRERLRPRQAFNILLALVGVLVLAGFVGKVPWIAMTLAFTFALYGLMRKIMLVDGMVSVTVETLAMTPIALAYVGYMGAADGLTANRFPNLGLLMLSGPVTTVPLLFFGAAARRLRLSTMGILQYLSPTLQFLLAVVVFQEPFSMAQIVSFACIWNGHCHLHRRVLSGIAAHKDGTARTIRGRSMMILRADMDAFYASVEERDRPELVGKPVIVGGSPEKRGVVSTANYVARKYGIHSAMPAVIAHRLCPQGVFLPPRIDYYAEVSGQIREIFERFTPLVEPLSLDEAFLDVTGSEHLFGSAIEIGRQIKQAIRQELRLVVSVGIAPNKFLAKIASDLKKPDALVVVEPDKIQEFLDPLPVERLWGVGRQSSKVFQQLGIHTIGQLRPWPLDVLQNRFGNNGEYLWNLAHGIDDRPVVPEREAKSISHETTFEHDISDMEVLRSWLLELTEQVGSRLRRHGLRGRTVQLKVRFADFSLITRSLTFPEPTNITQELWQAADEMLCQRLPAAHSPVRLVGIGVSGLDDTGLIQNLLFDQEERQKHSLLDAVADQVKERFGTEALRRGSSLEHGEKREPS